MHTTTPSPALSPGPAPPCRATLVCCSSTLPRRRSWRRPPRCLPTTRCRSWRSTRATSPSTPVGR
ncbi:hypothetical protein ACFQU2_24815 [Siccirubricoccus deserti]